MSLESLERLEQRIAELTRRFSELKQSHQKALDELSVRDQRINELNEKLKEFHRTKVQIHSKIENIVKRLELMKTQS